MAIDEHDERTRRCPRLGHEVHFRYCRMQEGESLCLGILDCWWERFDVQSYVEEHYGAEEVERLQNREPGSKMGTILDLIQQAKQRAGGGEEA
ncbi:MAG: hypothetical protein R6V05_03665 [Candidatus Brocadiia bacterium]